MAQAQVDSRPIQERTKKGARWSFPRRSHSPTLYQGQGEHPQGDPGAKHVLVKSATTGCLPLDVSTHQVRPSSSKGMRWQREGKGRVEGRKWRLGVLKRLTPSCTQVASSPEHSRCPSLCPTLEPGWQEGSGQETANMGSTSPVPIGAPTLKGLQSTVLAPSASSAPWALLTPAHVDSSCRPTLQGHCRQTSQERVLEEEESFVFRVSPRQQDDTDGEQPTCLPRGPSLTDLRVQSMLRSCYSTPRSSDEMGATAPFLPLTPECKSEDSSPVVSRSSSATTQSSSSSSSQSGGRCLDAAPLRLFTAVDLSRATDEWEKSRVLGKGSFGSVYKGSLGNQDVAVKRLEEDKSGCTRQGTREYGTEVVVLSSIDHPNIVKLVGHCLETKCLVYEYMPGGNLSHKLARPEGFPWKHRTEVAQQVAAALGYLHSLPSPIVHRDLKPENILVDGTGTAKLGDVGLARILEGEAEITYTVCGTAGYIDPESMTTFVISPLADVYAFGLILLQLLTGICSVTSIHRILAEGGLVVRNPRRAVQLAKARLMPHLDTSNREVPPTAVVEGLMELALMCCQRKRVNRPDIVCVLGEMDALLNGW